MKRIPELDAIRGLAVLMVLVHNTGRYPQLHLGFIARNGWMGVDLFFVLSGFLITNVLLQARSERGYFKNFYVRRCLRIWPLYYSVLFLMFVIIPILRPSAGKEIFQTRSMPWWSYLIFLQNFLVPVITKAAGALAVTWSLAVEEQFYLLWPFIVYFCSESQLRKIAVAIVLASPLLRFYLVQHHVDIYSNTCCRLDGLMAGAFLALMLRSNPICPDKYVNRAWIALCISAPLALVTAGRAQWIVFSFTSLASVSFVYLALYSQQKWLRIALRNRFLVYTGTISYGIYVLEKIPSDMAQSFHVSANPWVVFPITTLMTYLAAMISWNALEKPCLRLKRFFEISSATLRNDGELLRVS
jgi:peptidoglycan/LPS O-acetylase OafA/YrhL